MASAPPSMPCSLASMGIRAGSGAMTSGVSASGTSVPSKSRNRADLQVGNGGDSMEAPGYRLPVSWIDIRKASAAMACSTLGLDGAADVGDCQAGLQRHQRPGAGGPSPQCPQHIAEHQDPEAHIAPLRRTRAHPPRAKDGGRSEEHTSELQSPCNLVCRLL